MPQNIDLQLGQYDSAVQAALAEMHENNIIKRIWEHDYTVWNASDPTELTNRLGWLRIMDAMLADVGRINELKQALQSTGYTHVLLLGMGGSSLAPEVFSFTFHDAENRLWLEVLDSTDPGAVLAYDKQLDIKKTLFIVATKSGGTAETLSAFKLFYNRALDELGSEQTAGQHFIAITDPGSQLVDIAKRYKFRDIYLNDPNIGGRYSVLSYFGIVPAVLAGVDVTRLLKNAADMAKNNQLADETNQGALIGAVMGELAKVGRDKVTLILSPAISSFGDWVEQLIAESTGKDGKGIVPVVGEAVGVPSVYGNDRLFVYMRLSDDDTYTRQINALQAAAHPVITITLDDRYDLGGQFFLWEMATAITGYRLGIHPFNQPNVEAAKNLARAKIQEYQKTGKLEQLTPTLEADGIQVIGDVQADSPAAALKAFLEKAEDGAYISVHAYVEPTAAATQALQAFQTKLRDTTKLATTIGYGPRFLHSTGQLHKGDAGKGLFIQFTADKPQDVAIPDEAGQKASAMSFGTLIDAQALGDRQALLDAKRTMIRFHLRDTVTGIQALTQSL
jgi:transaldolase / glucose-6-phosphate isomerase